MNGYMGTGSSGILIMGIILFLAAFILLCIQSPEM